MNRVITVYTADGKKIAEYKGKKLILIQMMVDMSSLTTKVRDIFIITVL